MDHVKSHFNTHVLKGSSIYCQGPQQVESWAHRKKESHRDSFDTV